MHELSITQSMLDLVLEEANKTGAGKVRKINLVFGDMAGVVGDCVQFYFEFLSRGTIAEGASVSLRKVPTRARCRECGSEFTPEEFDWSCPKCRKVSVEITAGRELFVESIEVE